MKPQDPETLRRIAQFEGGTEQKRDWPLGWCWRQVRVHPAALNRLCLEGYLETLFRSNSYTGYRLTDLGWATAGGPLPQGEAETPPEPVPLPEDLFADIVGHGDVKELLGAALSAERPVHVLLTGPPALAKSLFLWDLERVGGEVALWLVGSATSKAGLWDLVAQRRPRWLLVDEIDKMSSVDTAGLLSVMEGGRVVRAKVGRRLEETVPLWVVAAAGNEGPTLSTVMVPAVDPLVVAVGGLRSDRFAIWERSGRGPTLEGETKPDFAFWATDLRVASARADDAYAVKSGTSFAAPVASGVIGLLWEAGRRAFGPGWRIGWADVMGLGPFWGVKPPEAPVRKDNSYGYGLVALGPLIGQAALGGPTSGAGLMDSVLPIFGLAMVGMMASGMFKGARR